MMKIDTRILYIKSSTGEVLGIHTGNDRDFIFDNGNKILGVKPYISPTEDELLEIPTLLNPPYRGIVLNGLIETEG